jgi:hypothetical protein
MKIRYAIHVHRAITQMESKLCTTRSAAPADVSQGQCRLSLPGFAAILDTATATVL